MELEDKTSSNEAQNSQPDRASSPRPAQVRLFMCRIPPIRGEKYHIVGEVGESDPRSEPSRAFWSNASVKALMQQTPQPEYISICKKVRGDWRSVQVSRGVPFDGELCRRCNAGQRA